MLNKIQSPSVIEGVASSFSVSVPTLNYKEDYRVKEVTGNTIHLTNVQQSLERPEVIQMKVESRKNIYNGTTIEDGLQNATRSGVHLFVKLRQVWEIEDDSSSEKTHVPITGSLSLTVPSCGGIAEDDVREFIANILATLYDESQPSGDRLRDLMRGVLTPVEL